MCIWTNTIWPYILIIIYLIERRRLVERRLNTSLTKSRNTIACNKHVRSPSQLYIAGNVPCCRGIHVLIVTVAVKTQLLMSLVLMSAQASYAVHQKALLSEQMQRQ